jgi:hypothetical protein
MKYLQTSSRIYKSKVKIPLKARENLKLVQVIKIIRRKKKVLAVKILMIIKGYDIFIFKLLLLDFIYLIFS